MPTQNLKKRLCDVRFLMSMVEQKVRAEGKWIESPNNVQQANDMFVVGAVAIGCAADETTTTQQPTHTLTPTQPHSGGKRRHPDDVAQMSWITCVNIVRTSKRRQMAHAAEAAATRRQVAHADADADADAGDAATTVARGGDSEGRRRGRRAE